jgi:hypothetical protein
MAVAIAVTVGCPWVPMGQAGIMRMGVIGMVVCRGMGIGCVTVLGRASGFGLIVEGMAAALLVGKRHAYVLCASYTIHTRGGRLGRVSWAVFLHALTDCPRTFALAEELVVGGKGNHGGHGAQWRRLAGSCWAVSTRLCVSCRFLSFPGHERCRIESRDRVCGT